jgi:hypothetical protein
LSDRHLVTTACASATENVEVEVVGGTGTDPEVPPEPIQVAVHSIPYVAVSTPPGSPYVDRE